MTCTSCELLIENKLKVMIGNKIHNNNVKHGSFFAGALSIIRDIIENK